MLKTCRYAVTLPGHQGNHAPPEVVVVHLTADVGPDGEPLYTDVTGGVRVRISGNVAQLIDAAGRPASRSCLSAVPLP